MTGRINSVHYWWLRLVQQRIVTFRPCFLCRHNRFAHTGTGCVKCSCPATPVGIDGVYDSAGGKLL